MDVSRTHPGWIEVITGSRGTGFFEDVLAYHREVPCRKPRLMLQLSYVLVRRPRPTPVAPAA